MSILSERLKQLKIKNNILQKDIAQDNNITLRTYQRYENGEREPSASTLMKLADYFNVSLDYLSGRTNNPKDINDDKNNNDMQNLIKEEKELLKDFRILNKHEQNIIIGKISEMIYNKNVEENNLEIEKSEELISIDLRDKLNK